MIFKGFIFDIEGTLVDCVPQTLQSLQHSLARRGMTVLYETLQLYSGLDGDETLKLVAPSLNKGERKQLLEEDEKHYERTYLHAVRAFEGVRSLFAAIRQQSGAIALATDCEGEPLKAYRALIGVDDMIDHVACGADVAKGKPDPALIHQAVKKLGIPAAHCTMIGDTPYDCLAAVAAGAEPIGLLSGGFSREALLQAGAADVLAEVKDLRALLSGMPTPRLRA